MQLKEFNILLDVKKHNKIECIEVVQGDSYSNIFNISLKNGLNIFDLTGASVEIAFRKSDGTTVLQNDIAILNATEGRISCVLKTNTIASPGRVIAEVRVIDFETLLTSAMFEFHVRQSIVNDETIESTNEFPVLTQLISTTEGLIQQVGQIEAQVPAQVITDLNAVFTLANQVKSDLVTHKADSVSAHGVNLKANKTQEAWIIPTFQNGWQQGYLARYRKNEFGTLELRGTIASGTTTGGTVIFTLPLGYRPSVLQILTVSSYDGGLVSKNTMLLINTNGEVSIYGEASKTSITMNGTVFL